MIQAELSYRVCPHFVLRIGCLPGMSSNSRETIVFLDFGQRRIGSCRGDGRVNPWKNSKIRLPRQNRLLRKIKRRLRSENASGRPWNLRGEESWQEGPHDGIRA